MGCATSAEAPAPARAPARDGAGSAGMGSSSSRATAPRDARDDGAGEGFEARVRVPLLGAAQAGRGGATAEELDALLGGGAAKREEEKGDEDEDTEDTESERDQDDGTSMSSASGSMRRSARNPLRTSFRMSRKFTAKLHTEWGEEELEVGSMKRRRRLSEQSLARVMQDANIRKQFEAYLASENVANVLASWDALQAFDQRPEALRTKRATQDCALKLFDDFFSAAQLQRPTNRLLSIVSRETMRDLAQDLMIDKTGKVTQPSVGVIDNAFRVLHLRVHNVLKYEFLPGFLISEQFQSLYKNFQPTAPSEIDLRFDDALASNEQHQQHQQQQALDADVKFPELRKEPRGAGTMEVKENSDGSASAFTETKSRRASVREANEVLRDQVQLTFFNEFVFTARSLADHDDDLEARSVGAVSHASGSTLSRSASRSRSHVLGQQLEVVELHDELETLCEPDLSDAAKLRRLNRVLQRYAAPHQDLIHPRIRALDALYTTLVSSADKSPSSHGAPLVEALPLDLDHILLPVREAVLNRIGQRLVPVFKQSATYRRMLSRSTSDHSGGGFGASPAGRMERRYSSDAGASPMDTASSPSPKLAALSPSTGETIANLECLQTYCENVNVRPGLFGFSRCPEGEVTLDEVLSSAYGTLQLKRFARRLFQEENVVFLVKARQFRANALSANANDAYEVLHFAQEICNQFIAPGSPLEINISDTQRRDTLAAFEELSTLFFNGLNSGNVAPRSMLAQNKNINNNYEKESATQREVPGLVQLFDVALREIHTMVLRGLWDEFREDATYAEYCRKRLPVAQGAALANPPLPN